MFNPVELIIAKRDGGALTPDQIRGLIDAYVEGSVTDYQMSAFLMASFIQGLNGEETGALTEAMLYSGEVLDLSDIPGIKVDKHSTGGVGDKISLVLAPVVAACGVPVPMISGRGLGHTGGTLDKLESIPGFRVDLSTERYRELVAALGLAMIGQTAEVAPADRKIYALRDVTGTVDYTPFIAASIMSKKLAEGIDALVLDVKCGKGAFMKREADARLLAETLAGIAGRFGKQCVAWLTNMDAPLGYAAGNWPEVLESIRCLRGEEIPAVTQLSLTLAGEMIWMGGKASSPEEGEVLARAAIGSGRALERFAALVEAQGGDPTYIYEPERRAFSPCIEVRAPESVRGYVAGIDALAIGKLTVAIGAGRMRKEDEVDPTAGIVLNKCVGDPVEPGELVARLYTHRTNQADDWKAATAAAFAYGSDAGENGTLLLDRYESTGWRNKG